MYSRYFSLENIRLSYMYNTYANKQTFKNKKQKNKTKKKTPQNRDLVLNVE